MGTYISHAEAVMRNIQTVKLIDGTDYPSYCILNSLALSTSSLCEKRDT